MVTLSIGKIYPNAHVTPKTLRTIFLSYANYYNFELQEKTGKNCIDSILKIANTSDRMLIRSYDKFQRNEQLRNSLDEVSKMTLNSQRQQQIAKLFRARAIELKSSHLITQVESLEEIEILVQKGANDPKSPFYYVPVALIKKTNTRVQGL